jgi:exodeoxyribonuclease VII large subunit
MNERHVFTVSELNRSARERLETHFGEIWLKGEVSEMKRAASGHLYFTLKDDEAEIGAVRFRSRTSAFTPLAIAPGTMVLALGTLTVYEPRGRYQFVASLLQPLGEGALQAAIERLKARLKEEGLFDPAHRKPIPPFPSRIGVVTSPTGAALRDVRSVLERRWPIAEVFLFPTSVQGESAPDELVAALERAARFSERARPLDVLILTRGGGSAEDLAAFSDERVVRGVFACPIPIVSAVGHEIDSALTDFVADLRAPTPASAAELVAPDRGEILELVASIVSRMTRGLATRLRRRSDRLRTSIRPSLLRIPEHKIEILEQRLDGLVERLGQGMARAVSLRAERIGRLEDVLRLSDPGLPLRRGYSLTYLKGSSRALRDTAGVSTGSELETRLGAGRLRSRVEEVMDA